MVEIVVKLIVSAILYLLSAWALTGLLAHLHDNWWAVIPSMGYGTALLAVILAGVVTSPWHSWKDSKK